MRYIIRDKDIGRKNVNIQHFRLLSAAAGPWDYHRHARVHLITYRNITYHQMDNVR